MDNPYRAPKGEITHPEKEGSGKFWKFLFWFYAAMIPLLLLGLAMAKNLSAFDLIDVLVFFIIVLGLYGFSYKKAFFGQMHWKVITFLYPLWWVSYETLLPFVFGGLNYGKSPSIGLLFGFSALMASITTLAFYLYSFRSISIWQPK